MSDKIWELIKLLNAKEIEAFKVLTTKQKGTTIIKDFEKYYSFLNKSANAKNDEEKERSFFETERYFVKANQEIGLLNEDELYCYIGLVNNMVLNAIKARKENSYADNKLLFGTLINKMPEELSSQNAEAVQNVKKNIEDYDSIMSIGTPELND